MKKENKNQVRSIGRATMGDEDLGPLKLLPGKWKGVPGQGWNMIALPFGEGESSYRVLVNSFIEGASCKTP